MNTATKTLADTPAPQPATDSEARMRAFQIVGSDIGAAAVFRGDWHKALKTVAAAWAGEPLPTQPANQKAPA